MKFYKVRVPIYLFFAEKDKEKQKLLNRNQELKLQELELQRKVNELSSSIVVSSVITSQIRFL